MADLSLTASQVFAGTGAVQIDGLSGDSVSAGRIVYRDATGKYQEAQANTETTAAAVGIALNNCPAANQPLEVLTGGNLTNNAATFTVGETYCVSSATAGVYRPQGDLATSDWVTIIGIATTTSNLRLAIKVSGVQVP